MEKKWMCQEDILCGVNKPKDKDNLSDLEKKHLPIIEAPDKAKKDEVFNVTIEVGKLLAHPNEAGHFIEWIELLADGRAYRQFLNPGDAPEATFNLEADSVAAREYCNLHGLWKG